MQHTAWRTAAAVLALALLAHTGVSLRRRSHAQYQCEMTYMRPSYHPVNISTSNSGRYGLYLYEDAEAKAPEGAAALLATGHALPVRWSLAALSFLLGGAGGGTYDIPVLFLPGNVGNHQQVGPLVRVYLLSGHYMHSIALRQLCWISTEQAMSERCRCGRWRPRQRGRR